MRNLNILLLTALLVPVFASGARAEDKYAQLAAEITEAGSSIHGKKIAIIPFSYADGRAGATKDGSVISERLTIKMINMHKFEIIERSVLDKVMNELKLQASGAIDASSAQQLGKVLGVEAIVTGTLVEMQAGEIEVNARLIKTETAQAIGASQVTVQKNWMGDAATAPQQPAYQQPAYQQPAYQQPAAYQQPVKAYTPRSRGEYEYGYFDIFLGLGNPNMSLKFYNSNGNITLNDRSSALLRGSNDLGISLTGQSTNRDFNTVQWDKLQTSGFGPVALRVGGYGNNNVGGAFELGLEKHNIKPQDTTWRLNSGSASPFAFTSDDYMSVTSFYFAGDLMVRFAKKTPIEPYIGFGLGMSLNIISLPYVKGFTNSSTFSAPTDDVGLGLVLNVPFGVRIRMADKTQVVAELRWQMNTFSFDRGSISGERDTATINGLYFNVGMGFDF